MFLICFFITSNIVFQEMETDHSHKNEIPNFPPPPYETPVSYDIINFYLKKFNTFCDCDKTVIITKCYL